MTIHSISGGPVAPPRPVRYCPLTVRAAELVGSVAASECLGEACMAAVPVTDDAGRAVGVGCALCLTPQTINVVAAQLAALHALVQHGMQAQGLLPATPAVPPKP
ncbi:MAG: hypothetical protein KKD10_07285 [Candidatus Omnitrophica bacterium]|nr:hypothetical protein [Candidatus Omnitrophota bacterium]